MIYAMSDIHGQYELFRNLMEQIPLGKDDILYVLGDVVDRGPDSMNTLKYMMANPNIIPIMGNHELMALPCLKLLVPGWNIFRNQGSLRSILWRNLCGKEPILTSHISKTLLW